MSVHPRAVPLPRASRSRLAALSPSSRRAALGGHPKGVGGMDLAWQQLPPALRVVPRRHDDPLLLPHRGLRIPVAIPRPPDYGLFVARFLARAPHEPPPG